MTFLISAVIFAIVVGTNGSIPRNKRQAPNINVHDIPKTSFTCADKKIGEYYADAESHCQVYHVCVPGMNNKASLISFVCPNGTIFSQATRVCTPFASIDCSLTKFYESSIKNDAPGADTDDYDNYVPPPRQPAPQPPRQSSSSRSRNTPAPPPPPPPAPAQPPRNNRFRSGSSQFRGQQGQPATTQAPARTSPPQVARVPVAPARPAPPAFRTPVVAARPPQNPASANVLPPRPTVRATVSTSTASYNYDYEYEYEYEDEAPNAEGAARSKREVISPEESAIPDTTTSFTCEDKVPGGAYADIERNCEMFHICVLLGEYKVLDYKVFCANGTAFDQETGSCREKGEFICENAQLFYQFEKPNQPKSTKKPVMSKKKFPKYKKSTSSDKE
ncbi:hypothetical protein CDAR_526161 [Caerostris darwini]|uniref:Chitin-binding type-2 domain-containing protein n=1 Tax=Caerostris darwini TaxID=1538125 RepID=A0AAV4UHU9_9ARAC|nr:hypothetical protein CDAR_526161 [Caerostris darwini]